MKAQGGGHRPTNLAVGQKKASLGAKDQAIASPFAVAGRSKMISNKD